MAQDEEPADPGISPVAEESKRKKEAERTQHTSLPRGVGTSRTKSTVLLCRLANQTIVCSPMGHGRRREKRSRIDPRRHRQLITQIYVPIVHCLSPAGAGRSGPERARAGPPKPCATVNDSMEEAALRCCSPTLWVGVREVCSKNGERATTNDREDDRVVDDNEEDDNEGPS